MNEEGNRLRIHKVKKLFSLHRSPAEFMKKEGDFIRRKALIDCYTQRVSSGEKYWLNSFVMRKILSIVGNRGFIKEQDSIVIPNASSKKN